jgi:hypothetical protein
MQVGPTTQLLPMAINYATYHHHTRSLHVMHNTSKCTGASLAPTMGYAPQHLGHMDLETPPTQPFAPLERLPQRWVLRVMTMHIY